MTDDDINYDVGNLYLDEILLRRNPDSANVESSYFKVSMNDE